MCYYRRRLCHSLVRSVTVLSKKAGYHFCYIALLTNYQIVLMELLTPSFGLIFWTLLSFIIVLVILKKYAWGPILSSLNEREKGIADSLETAERVKREMTQLKSENEELLAKAREERAAMLKDARDTKDRIVNEAKDQAKLEANKIISEAQQAIQAQKMAAITDVKNQLGKLVIEVTEKVLRKELANKEAQEEHIKGLVNEVKLN